MPEGAALAAQSLAAQEPAPARVRTDEEGRIIDDDEVAQVATLDPWLRTVQGGGSWKAGGKYGDYRLVVIAEGFEHVSTAGYLQWIWANEDSSTIEVISTVPLKEIGRGFWSFGEGDFCYLPDGSVELLIPATHSYSLEKETFRFRLGAPGQYQFLETPAPPRVRERCG